MLLLFQSKSPKMDKSKARVLAPEVPQGAGADEKRKLFDQAIDGLASLDSDMNSEEIDDFVRFFVELYDEADEKFRHMYSDVCAILFGFLVDNGKLDDGVPPQAVKLANNVALLLEEIKRRNPDSRAVGCVLKLSDHIELENKRMRYMTLQNRAQQKSAKSLRKKFETSLASEVDKASKSFDERVKAQIEETQQKLQRNYISILGIFAAIVVAFMSGTAFSSSVLENIDKASIYRISFVVLIVAFFMFNLVCALFMFLNKVSEIKNRAMVWLLVVADVVFVVLITLVVLARAFDVVSHFPFP